MDQTTPKPEAARAAGGDFKLLGPNEPPAAFVHHAEGASDIFLTCDHAGNLIPERLGGLGLAPLDLARHIAWDVGASGLCRRLAALLDATTVTQTYSRLVIDCNRSPRRHDSMAPLSEATEIPGNLDIPPEQAAARRREIFQPYHDAITEALEARDAAGRRTMFIAMHSFTPVYHGVSRPWHIGLLYNRDARLANILKELMAGDPELCIGDNEPYAISDESDYGIPVHGEQRGIPHIEIEVRHDLIETAAHQAVWAERFAGWFTRVLALLNE